MEENKDGKKAKEELKKYYGLEIHHEELKRQMDELNEELLRLQEVERQAQVLLDENKRLNDVVNTQNDAIQRLEYQLDQANTDKANLLADCKKMKYAPPSHPS